MNEANAENLELLEEVYSLLGVSSPSALIHAFIAEDQRLMTSQTWDYKNTDLVINKVKEIVEQIIESGFTTRNKLEDDDLRDILWFWYHHAIGYAIWSYKDKNAAQVFSIKALKYQISDNPNKITRLLYLLVHEKEHEVDEYLKTITDEPDKEAAKRIFFEYKAGNFFKA
ncbi:MAG: hypothetical protein JWL88_497 [Parcubacteria group bacterium]|nr:hypothetical protein [Parcubacteria group bacterium]